MSRETKLSEGFKWGNRVFPEGTTLRILPHSDRCLSDKGIVGRRETYKGEGIFYLACLKCAGEGVIPAITASAPIPRR